MSTWRVLVSIQQFMQRYYKKLDGDRSLEDMDWDMRLLRRLKEALQCDTEVACQHGGHGDLVRAMTLQI